MIAALPDTGLTGADLFAGLGVTPPAMEFLVGRVLEEVLA